MRIFILFFGKRLGDLKGNSFPLRFLLFVNESLVVDRDMLASIMINPINLFVVKIVFCVDEE